MYLRLVTTSNEPSRTDITTEEDFHEALRALVVEADANGVDVRGGWPVFRDDDSAAWDVEVTGVTQRSTAHVGDAWSPVASIIQAVASREGVDTTDLPPLHDAVEPELLETLRPPLDDGPGQHLAFQYLGYRITVRSDGAIILDG